MKKFYFLLLMLYAYPLSAHESQNPSHPVATIISTALEQARVSITKDKQFVYIHSNGIPSHQTGDFPNRANPNSISAQNHKYRVTRTPQKARKHNQGGVMGVALNGVPFEPGTAECYGKARGSAPSKDCEWREEAIVNGNGRLGLDNSNAHVQPTGTYHYHGVPWGMIKGMQGQNGLFKLGYAADGFPIYFSDKPEIRSSYQLKRGTRSSGPMGKHDGTYTADFKYVSGSGTLDQCNGTTINGSYVYFVTREFPFSPRCLMGPSDQSFMRHGGSNERSNSKPRHGMPPPKSRY